MFTLFYIQTENHFTWKVDNRRSLAPQGSTTNECCSICRDFLEISFYIQIPYADCFARLPQLDFDFRGKKENLSHVTIDPVLGTETIDYIIAKNVQQNTHQKRLNYYPQVAKNSNWCCVTSQRNQDHYFRIVYSRDAIALKSRLSIFFADRVCPSCFCRPICRFSVRKFIF